MLSPARSALLVFTLSGVAALAATTTVGYQLSQSQINDIIQKFAAKESEFAKARGNYTYRQSVKVETLDESGTPDGKWELVSDIIFTPDGKRTEKVVYAPMSTLERILLTPQDMQDLRDVQPFVLTSDQIGDYYVNYLGHEQVDEVPCYVFSVKPKKLESGKRYFEGQIWVDDKYLQIVKTDGRGIGHLSKSEEKSNKFPRFQTYREQIDGKYWFPVYTYANDTLNFEADPVRVKMVVQYKDYKQFGSDVNIRYADDTNDKGAAGKAAPAEELAPPLAQQPASTKKKR
ncbi:MAG TPA: hypothetical protein VFA04_05140 [Bryobacteraceae bacterium]|nr:hypothetical protein [Bryobacteraceae bacterium]